MDKKSLTDELFRLGSIADDYVQLSKEERKAFIDEVAENIPFLTDITERLCYLSGISCWDEELDQVPGAVIKGGDLVIRMRYYVENIDVVNVTIEYSFTNSTYFPFQINYKSFANRVKSILDDTFQCSTGSDCVFVYFPTSKSPINVVKQIQSILNDYKDELFLLAHSL